MATSMLELGVGTGKWDAGLKKAKQSLDNFTQANGGLQQALEKESQKMQKFVQMMGQMDSTAKTAKGQMNDYKATIEQLTMQYNRMSEAQKKTIGQDYLNSIEQIKEKFRQAKAEMEGINKSLGDMKMPDMKGGGFLSGIGDKMSGALQVFGGNLMTKGAGMLAGLASEMGDMVKQGVELAKQGEGIRNAFERLGRGDILDGLRQATHGTVTDIELMKAAVKFNDFKLPLDELGTMLAFAQQKAKDTGQSVDFLVESIVNGLGRKSLMILDNLGLSATEIKDKMAETGDMTKAVGAIIREQMSKAGDYVETAADRAAQANVSLQNKMEELGRKFAPVEEASSQLWTSMKIGILDIIGGPLATLLNQLTEAGRLKNQLNNMNGEPGSGNTKVDQQLKKLNVIKKGGGSNYIFNSTLNGMMEDYNRQIMDLDAQIKNGGKKPGAGSGESQDVRYLQQKMDALKMMRDQLAAGAKEINKPIKIESNIPDVTGGGKGKGSGSSSGSGGIKEEKDDFEEIVGLIPNAQEAVRSLQQQISQSWDEGEIARLTEDLKEAQAELQRLQNIGKETKETPMVQGLSGFNQETMSAWMQGRQSDLSKAEYGSPDYSSIMGNIADMNIIKSILEQSVNAGINAAEFNVAPMWDKIFGEALPEGMEGTLSEALSEMYENAFDGMDIDDSAFEALVGKINEKLKDMGIDPIEIPIKTVDKDVKAIAKSASITADVVGSIGDAFNAIEDPAAKVAGTVMQAIASIALGYAQATVQATSMGPWAWVAFAATGLATMLSTISAIHSSTGYAEGGMIKGNSYSGDNIGGMVDGGAGGFVGLNAGEIVLNKSQQTALASQLQGNGINGINLSGRIKGTDIILSVDRSLQLQGKQLLTWG